MKADTISNMIDTVWDEFWSIDVADPKTQKQVLKIYRIIQIIARVYGYNVLFATVFFIIGAILTGEKSVPMDIWLPNKEILKISPYFEIISILETVLTITSAMFCLIPFDALLIMIIGLVYCQFILLSEQLLKLSGNKDNYETIRKCVAHHNLLLK